MYKNVCQKYGVTESEVKTAVETISKHLGKIINPLALVAVTDLLVNGDIQNKKSKEDSK